MWSNRNPTLLVEIEHGAAAAENSWAVPQKTKQRINCTIQQFQS